MVFKNNVDDLINDPLIISELQKYFPISEFQTENEARMFYKVYLNLISKSGCGYAVAANAVFCSFEGREDEFESVFGYPMYTINRNGIVDFYYNVNIYSAHDIIASEGFSLYHFVSAGNEMMLYDDVGLHYVYITDITNSGRVVVSSWGNRYYFDDTDTNELYKIKLRIQ